jgi:hypothetical protein
MKYIYIFFLLKITIECNLSVPNESYELNNFLINTFNMGELIPILSDLDQVNIYELNDSLSQLLFSGQESMQNGKRIIQELIANLKKCQDHQCKHIKLNESIFFLKNSKEKSKTDKSNKNSNFLLKFNFKLLFFSYLESAINWSFR